MFPALVCLDYPSTKDPLNRRPISQAVLVESHLDTDPPSLKTTGPGEAERDFLEGPHGQTSALGTYLNR